MRITVKTKKIVNGCEFLALRSVLLYESVSTCPDLSGEGVFTAPFSWGQVLCGDAQDVIPQTFKKIHHDTVKATRSGERIYEDGELTMRILTIYLTYCLWLGTMGAYGKIVFQSGRDGNLEIYSMTSHGGSQTRLTHHEASDGEPAWSPNGRQIVFMSERDGDWEIYVMDADGGNQRNLTQHPALDGEPTWSPDGSQIAFASSQAKGYNIYVMDADGANVRPLTEGASSSNPKWSPDGERIAFEGMVVPGAGRQIYVINADGTNRWQVSEPIPQAGMFLAGWSPNGKKILYIAAIDYVVMKSFPVIATLHPRRREAVKHERVPLPKKMHLNTAAWGVDGKSVLVTLREAPREEGGEWNIYRFHLPDGPLIQLTDHPATDIAPHEWNPRLPVSPLGLAPERWGEIKSH